MQIERVSASRGLSWVTEGFALFRAAPLIWIVDVILLIAALSLLSIVPLVGSIAATLLQPVLAAGLLQGCRDLECGRELRLEHLSVGFGEKAKPLFMVGFWLGLASIGVAVILVAAVLGTGIVSSASLESWDWARGAPQLPDQAALVGGLLAVNLTLLLYLPVAMAAWFAPALVIFHDLDAWDALKASFVGCLRNAWPFLIYGVALLLLLLLAVIPLGLGLLIWLPMLFGSVYASYREIYPQAL